MRGGRASPKVKTIRDIARICGVSKATVSRALNDSPLVAQKTRDRIKAVARGHGFRLNATARRLSTRSSRTIAFVTHPFHKGFSVADLFGLEIMGGISRGLAEHQYDLLVVHVDPRDTEWAPQYLNTGRVDGFILMTSTQKRQHVDYLLKMGAPFIAWGHGQGRHCSVVGDDLRGGRLATDHLIGAGRTRIAFLGGPRVELEVQLRYRGYREALTGAGLVVEPDLVAYGDYSDRSGALAMEQILRKGRPFDAVFVNSDLMAIAAMGVLKARGLRVPEDVAVVGYDDLSISGYAAPPLTTVSQNVPLAGRYLARDLVAYIENGVVTETVVPVDLVVRGSA
jgi:DNA-binding LacI/PurR family transcriptional regulator